MKSFCPFINGECRSDCVFRKRKCAVSSGETTECLLVSVIDSNDALCDIIIQEKQSKSSKKE